MVIAAWGYHGAYSLAGVIALVAAALSLLLRQPGRERLRDIRPNPQPTSREII